MTSTTTTTTTASAGGEAAAGVNSSGSSSKGCWRRLSCGCRMRVQQPEGQRLMRVCVMRRCDLSSRRALRRRIAAASSRLALVCLCPLLLCLLSTLATSPAALTASTATAWRRLGCFLWSIPLLPAGLCCLAVVLLLVHSLGGNSCCGESVLLVPGLGVQHCLTDGLGRPSWSRFIPAQAVRDIVVHEYVTFTRIFPLLTVVLRDSPPDSSLYQLFADCCLPLPVLADIYRRIRTLGSLT